MFRHGGYNTAYQDCSVSVEERGLQTGAIAQYSKVRISSWTGSSDGPARMGDVAVSHTPTSSVRNEQSLLRVINFRRSVWCEDVSIQARAVNERKIDLPHARSQRGSLDARWLQPTLACHQC